MIDAQACVPAPVCCRDAAAEALQRLHEVRERLYVLAGAEPEPEQKPRPAVSGTIGELRETLGSLVEVSIDLHRLSQDLTERV